VQEFWRGVRARQAMLRESAPRALSRLVGKNRRRYGGYIIHHDGKRYAWTIPLAFPVEMALAQTLKPGETMQVGKFTLRYDKTTTDDNDHVSRLAAQITVLRGDTLIGTLAPEKRFYKKPQQPTTEVAMRSTLTEDLYLVLGSYDPPSGIVTLQAYVNPLVAWLWIGGVILFLGTVVTMWPSAAERRETALALDRAAVPAE